MPKLAKFLVAGVTALVLTGCLVPEKFTAEAACNPDGSYTYKFDGTVVNAMVAMAKTKKPLSDKDRADIAKENEKFAKDPSVKKFIALSDTRYQLVTEEVLPLERRRTARPTDVFMVGTQDWKKDRTLSVTDPKMNPNDQKMMTQLGIQIDGKAMVVLPAGAKVTLPRFHVHQVMQPIARAPM